MLEYSRLTTAAKRAKGLMSDFLAMGGYGQYVWPAYAVSALAIGGLAFHVWRRGRDLQRKLRGLENARRDQSPPA
jgi:heme exporter protein D